jgi:hypothetical protein
MKKQKNAAQHVSMIASMLVAGTVLAACGGGSSSATSGSNVTPSTSGNSGSGTSTVINRPETKDCENGAVITAITPNAGFARVGSVFSKTLYQASDTEPNTTHQPQKIQVQVSLNGKGLAACNVAWIPKQGEQSGWVFADSQVSDSNGFVSAWWTAGAAASQSLDVSIQQKDGTIKSTTILGSATPHATRANSIHLSWSTPAWDKFSAEVTPITWEPTTYYEVIGINGGYTGIQSHQLLFSLWDVNGVSPVVIDKGTSKCSNFGGEGTGIKCETPFTPKTNVTYRFEMEVVDAPAATQDYTVFFTDTSSNVRQKLATMRLPRPQINAGAYGFVEDWATEGSSCLDNKPRSAYFGNVKFLDHATGAWVNVNKASGTAVYTPSHNEVCSNYSHTVEAGRFKLSTGGTSVGQPLNMPGGPRSTAMVLP